MQIEVKGTITDPRYVTFVANFVAYYQRDPSSYDAWEAALRRAESQPSTDAEQLNYAISLIRGILSTGFLPEKNSWRESAEQWLEKQHN